jgi:predicted kinase
MTDFLKAAVSVVVLRGVPGSGKSRLQSTRWHDALVVSADHFFMHTPECKQERYIKSNESKADWVKRTQIFICDCTGYHFDPTKLGEAHGACLRRFIDNCRGLFHAGGASFNTIVVDNTNLSIAEMAPYVAVAQAYDIPVEIVTVVCDPAVAAKRNTHGVPEERVLKMAAALTEGTKAMPPWWRHTATD